VKGTHIFRSISPAGAPIQGDDLFYALKAGWIDNDPVERFRSEICRYFGTKHSFLVSSGKAALAVSMSALSRISARREVIIPAFSSFCLPSAVAKVGLKITLCDVSPETLDFDLDRLKNTISERTLCVIPVHLFGLSAQVEEIRKMAKEKGAYVIEDAAQAAGAQLNGRKLGTIGEMGVFSLGRGKNITTVDGGVIVTQSDSLAGEISASADSLRPKRRQFEPTISTVVKALAISVFLDPRLYWFPERIPFLNLGASEFSTDFKVDSFSKLQSVLGMLMLQRLNRYNEIRRANSSYLMAQLKDIEGIRIPKPIVGSYPVYLRFPLLICDPAVREAAFRSLIREGLGASKTYPSALNAINDLKLYAVNAHLSYANAEATADRVLTLPTHSYVTHEDLDRMVQVLRSLGNGLVKARGSEQTNSVHLTGLPGAL